MALSTQDPTLAMQRLAHATSVRGQAAIQALIITFKSWLMTQGGRPDLQVKEFDKLTGTSTVIADAACKVYAIVLIKVTTTAAYFKGSDNATTGSSTTPEISLRQKAAEPDAVFFPKGWPCANGFSIISNTTGSGNTTSAAGDGAYGVVLLGKP